jgi:2-dehydropantoate 2-reductase
MECPVLIVGPGAVGLALATGLRRAGIATALLARTAAKERRLAQAGFRVARPDGAQSRTAGLFSARTLNTPVDAAFFCVKSADVKNAALTAKRWIGPSTAVVALQNGIGHEKIFRRAYGSKRTVIGVCYFAADRISPERLKLNGGKDVLLARHSDNALAAQRARDLLSRADFCVHMKNSEAGMLWTKAAFNAAVNPLAASCAIESGKVIEDAALQELSLQALKEATAAAQAAGHDLDYSAMAAQLALSGQAAPHQRNSMLQDLRAGRRTEVKAILGPFLSSARRHHRHAPTLALLADIVAHLERRLRK